MPHVGPVLNGRTFCPHCGALYSATPSLVPKSEPDAVECVVCHKVMDRSNTSKAGATLSLSTDLKMPDRCCKRPAGRHQKKRTPAALQAVPES